MESIVALFDFFTCSKLTSFVWRIYHQ